MILLTDQQLHAIRDIIRRHHAAVIVSTLGADALSPDERAMLESAGMFGTAAEEGIESVREAYLLGQLVAESPDEFGNIGYEELRRRISERTAPLTTYEERAIEVAAHQAADRIRNLGGRVATDTGQILTEAEERAAIRGQIVEGVERRLSLGEIKTRLGALTEGWDRDWDRVAVSEVQDARLSGQAAQYRESYGPDVYVAKLINETACPACRRLHTGPDGAPRIFRLRELESHGTNVGRKAAEWQAVVGITHPQCACSLVRVPTGFGFDENGDMVPGGTRGIRYETEEAMQRAIRQEHDLQKAAPPPTNLEPELVIDLVEKAELEPDREHADQIAQYFRDMEEWYREGPGVVPQEVYVYDAEMARQAPISIVDPVRSSISDEQRMEDIERHAQALEEYGDARAGVGIISQALPRRPT